MESHIAVVILVLSTLSLTWTSSLASTPSPNTMLSSQTSGTVTQSLHPSDQAISPSTSIQPTAVETTVMSSRESNGMMSSTSLPQSLIDSSPGSVTISPKTSSMSSLVTSMANQITTNSYFVLAIGTVTQSLHPSDQAVSPSTSIQPTAVETTVMSYRESNGMMSSNNLPQSLIDSSPVSATISPKTSSMKTSIDDMMSSSSDTSSFSTLPSIVSSSSSPMLSSSLTEGVTSSTETQLLTTTPSDFPSSIVTTAPTATKPTQDLTPSPTGLTSTTLPDTPSTTTVVTDPCTTPTQSTAMKEAVKAEQKRLDTKISDLEDEVNRLTIGVVILSTILGLILIAFIVMIIRRGRRKDEPMDMEDPEMRKEHRMGDSQKTYFRRNSLFDRGMRHIIGKNYRASRLEAQIDDNSRDNGDTMTTFGGQNQEGTTSM